MKKRTGLQLLLAAVLFGALAACAGSASPGGDASPTRYNPASDRMGALAGLPPESDMPSGGVIPNPAPLLEAGRLASANTEGSIVKTAARAYFNDHPSAIRLSSDDLQPPYISGPTKARYEISLLTLSITRVDSVAGGWVGIVFSLSQQKWVKGAADNDRENDQDVP